MCGSSSIKINMKNRILNTIGLLYLLLTYYFQTVYTDPVLTFGMLVGAVICFITSKEILSLEKSDSSEFRKKFMNGLITVSSVFILVLMIGYFFIFKDIETQKQITNILLAVPVVSGCLGLIAYGKMDPY